MRIIMSGGKEDYPVLSHRACPLDRSRYSVGGHSNHALSADVNAQEPRINALRVMKKEAYMRYRLLGNSGLRVSEAALGTMTFGEDWGWGVRTGRGTKGVRPHR